jgi:hypothetical protein
MPPNDDWKSRSGYEPELIDQISKRVALLVQDPNFRAELERDFKSWRRRRMAVQLGLLGVLVMFGVLGSWLSFVHQEIASPIAISTSKHECRGDSEKECQSATPPALAVQPGPRASSHREEPIKEPIKPNTRLSTDSEPTHSENSRSRSSPDTATHESTPSHSAQDLSPHRDDQRLSPRPGTLALIEGKKLSRQEAHDIYQAEMVVVEVLTVQSLASGECQGQEFDNWQEAQKAPHVTLCTPEHMRIKRQQSDPMRPSLLDQFRHEERQRGAGLQLVFATLVKE